MVTDALYACNTPFHFGALALWIRFDAYNNTWSSSICWLKVKSVKPCLKQLQQCIQTISTLQDDEILPTNPAALFHWLPKEHMCVLVYLVRDTHSGAITSCVMQLWRSASLFVLKVTVMHSMQAGYLEKAQKYTDKALMQLEKLKSKFVGMRCLFPLMWGSLNQFCPTHVCSKCWTAAPSCPPSKSSYWSISSCAGWWLDTRPRHYKRYSLCCTCSHHCILPYLKPLLRLWQVLSVFRFLSFVNFVSSLPGCSPLKLPSFTRCL